MEEQHERVDEQQPGNQSYVQSGGGDMPATPLCRCRVLYLGSAVPTISKDGLQGIQEPLRERYALDAASTDAKGIDSWLSVWSNGLLLEYVEGDETTEAAFFPIKSLHYCAAVRYVNVSGYAIEGGGERFLPLDSPFAASVAGAGHPPMFAAIFRRTSGVRVLECHAFICTNERAANALVRSCFHSYADCSFLDQNEQLVKQLPGGQALSSIKEHGEAADDTSSRSAKSSASSESDMLRWSERAVGAQTWQRRQQTGDQDAQSISSSMANANRYKKKQGKDKAARARSREKSASNAGTMQRRSEMPAEYGAVVPYTGGGMMAMRRAGSDSDLHGGMSRGMPPPFYPMGPGMGPPHPGMMMGPGGPHPMMFGGPGSPQPPPPFMQGPGPMPPPGMMRAPMMGPPGPGPPMGPGMMPPPGMMGPGRPPHPGMMGPPPGMMMGPGMMGPSPGPGMMGPSPGPGMMGPPPGHPMMGPPHMMMPGPPPPGMFYPPGDRDADPTPIITAPDGSQYGTLPRGPVGGRGGMRQSDIESIREEPIYMPGAMPYMMPPAASYAPGNYEHYEAYYDANHRRRSHSPNVEKKKKGSRSPSGAPRQSQSGKGRSQSRRIEDAALDQQDGPDTQYWDSFEAGIYRKPMLNERAFAGTIQRESGTEHTNGHSTTANGKLRAKPPSDDTDSVDRPCTPPADYDVDEEELSRGMARMRTSQKAVAQMY